jgi:hypothetical protein
MKEVMFTWLSTYSCMATSYCVSDQLCILCMHKLNTQDWDVHPSVCMFQRMNWKMVFFLNLICYALTKSCSAVLIFIKLYIIEICFQKGVLSKERVWKLVMLWHGVHLSSLVYLKTVYTSLQTQK